jgi:hypothetical protein
LEDANFCSFKEHSDGAPKFENEKRLSVRFVHEEPVILETQDGDLIGAVVMNYSISGLYFESDLKIQEGAILRIRNESTLSSPEAGGCCAEVRWSRALNDQTAEHQYGTGVRYC